jgi:colanic acid/amylovoran biosynthesis protein
VHLDGDFRAADLKAIIGQCQLVISSRYHALIAAMSQGIAVGTAGWSHKYTELLEETGGGLTFSHTDDTAVTLERLDYLVKQREKFTSQLQMRIPHIQQNSREALDLVLSMIAEPRSLSA